jgi:hypothetical protein
MFLARDGEHDRRALLGDWRRRLVDRTLAPSTVNLALAAATSLPRAGEAAGCRQRPARQSGYSSLRQARNSSPGGASFGVRSSRKAKYGATNGSGAETV